MNAVDLIGCQVVDPHGRTVGRVHDLVFRRTDEGDGVLPRFELMALECGKAGVGDRLGFMREAMAGPWPLTVLFRWLSRHARVVEWSEVTRVGPRRIEIGKPRELVHRSIDVLPA
ncbi:hypothetical protein [Amycolatopsis pigmentata]|uniref:PRC-barrel domain-containing protein n=1 Tax=Amycolatopsis pigmentata TaxID=450801 RepID=A0ABW5FTP1_9PSEU